MQRLKLFLLLLTSRDRRAIVVNLQMDERVEDLGHRQGTTALVALIGAFCLWVANAGDCRALLVRQCQTAGVVTALPLSCDHKATRPDERARIMAAGGAVWAKRVNGDLAVSRAIGDHDLKPYVIPQPEVRKAAEEVPAEDEWCIHTNACMRV
jgi:serine/threonine protein phosphatase PrpC